MAHSPLADTGGDARAPLAALGLVLAGMSGAALRRRFRGVRG